MKLCIPSKKARLRLLNDWTLNITNADYYSTSLTELVDCPKIPLAGYVYRGKTTNDFVLRPGTITFPKGTILRIDALHLASRKRKRDMEDYMSFTIMETSLKRESGVNRRLRNRLITFRANSTDYNHIEYEYVV